MLGLVTSLLHLLDSILVSGVCHSSSQNVCDPYFTGVCQTLPSASAVTTIPRAPLMFLCILLLNVSLPPSVASFMWDSSKTKLQTHAMSADSSNGKKIRKRKIIQERDDGPWKTIACVDCVGSSHKYVGWSLVCNCRVGPETIPSCSQIAMYHHVLAVWLVIPDTFQVSPKVTTSQSVVILCMKHNVLEE